MDGIDSLRSIRDECRKNEGQSIEEQIAPKAMRQIKAEAIHNGAGKKAINAAARAMPVDDADEEGYDHDDDGAACDTFYSLSGKDPD